MFKRILLTSTLMLLVYSCSRIDLAVNLANSYLTSKIDDYFDLTREQSKWMKAALEKDIGQVKKTIFPQLAGEMLKTAEIISSQKTFDTAAVLMTYRRFENLFYQGVRIFTPNAVAFADKLSPAQVAYFQKEFDQKAKDQKEDSEKKSYDKIKKQFDSWAGSMTSNQKDDLKKFIAKNPLPVSETVYNRQLLVHEFVKSYPDRAARKKYVEKLFTDYESMKDANYAKVLASSNAKVAGFVTSVLNRMSEDQRKTLIETIRERANQLIKISKG